MQMNKRTFLKYLFALPLFGCYGNVFSSQKITSKKYIKEILSILGGKKLNYSNKVKVSLGNFPGIKEEVLCSFGEQVQIYVDSSLSEVSSISIFLENPNVARVAKYSFFNKSLPNVVSRYKVIENNNVCAVVETGNGLYYNTLHIKTGYLCHY